MSGGERNFGWLSDQEVELIVERVTQRVMENFYQEVGKSVVKKAFQAIGLVAVALSIWIAGGRLKMWGG
jgi:hypothetical protein